MRIQSVGHAVFAVIMIALGVQGLFKGDFTAVWAPIPKGVFARDELVYICAMVSLLSGIGLLLRRFATYAARVLLAVSCFGCCSSACLASSSHPKWRVHGGVVERPPQ